MCGPLLILSRPKLRQLDSLQRKDDPIFWPEICEIVRSSSNRKTPGIDGIPAQWIKLVIPKDGTTGTPSIPDEPDTVLGKHFLECIQRIFEEAYIPEVRNAAEVVTIMKLDPQTYMNNYRPISLIPSIMKLLCAILTNRIQRDLQERKFFAPEQAGFLCCEPDERTGPALRPSTHWWIPSKSPRREPTTHDIHHHEGEGRPPGFILTPNIPQRVVHQRQVGIR